MADENPGEETGEVKAVAPETVVDPPVEALEVEKKVETPGEAPAATPAVSEEAKTDWRDRRIAQLTARLREAEGKSTAAPPAVTPGETPANFEARVREEAARLAQADIFNRQCLEVVEAGKVAYPDFDSRVNELKRVADPSDMASATAYSNLIAAAIETGEGAKIIYQLGGNLNEATRLMGLSPVRMGMELAKMAVKEVEAVSGAPKPIRPLGSAAQHTAIDPSDPARAGKMSKEDWFKKREEQVAERRKRA